MIRPAFVFALAVQVGLALHSVPASAQIAGGEALDPEVLSTPGAAEILRDRAFGRLQALQGLQAIRSGGLFGPGVAGAVPFAGAAGNPNTVNPELDRSAVNQQALARIPNRGDAGFLAGFSGGQARAASRAKPPTGDTVQPTFIDNSKTLVVNAFGSPVSVGNGNIVQQQVANSTAISVGGSPATATAAADNMSKRGDRGNSGGTGASQSATSSATSLGGVAGSTAANGYVTSRGTPR